MSYRVLAPAAGTLACPAPSPERGRQPEGESVALEGDRYSALWPPGPTASSAVNRQVGAEPPAWGTGAEGSSIASSDCSEDSTSLNG